MKLRPHVGLGEVLLGSSRARVSSIFGEPTRRFVEKYGEDAETEYFEYENPKVTLGFDSTDGDALGTISIHDPEVWLNDKLIVGRSVSEILRDFPDFRLDEDLGELGSNYADSKRDIDFWATDGVVTCVSLFPDWIDENTPSWPKNTD